MFDALTGNALSHVAIVEEQISQQDVALGTADADRRQLLKLYVVSSCVTRLYAVFENFVHTLISDYLDEVPSVQNFASLSEGFKLEYRTGISHLLGRLENSRYKHLKHENVIRWYHEALTETSPYRFVTEALTRHEENLRISMVDTLLGRIQLGDLRGWLSRHSEIFSLYEEQTSVSEQFEAEFKNFVQLRNDAAHGVLSDLLGTDALLRLCSLVKAAVKALTSYLYSNLLKLRVDAGKAHKIGLVTEVFPKVNACVVQMTAYSSLSEGIKVHFLGSGSCGFQTIESLQVGGVAIKAVSTIQDAFEIGIRGSDSFRKNQSLYVDGPAPQRAV